MMVRNLGTNFTAGELSVTARQRVDLAVYANGAAQLRNVRVAPPGGASRRPGLRHVAVLPEVARLAAFEFNVEQIYLLAIGDEAIRVFKEDALQATIVTPWAAADIGQLDWTQSADTFIVVHVDYAPRVITRTSHTAWTIATLSYFVEDTDRIQQPYHKFAPDAATIQASGTTGSVTLTVRTEKDGANLTWFEAGHVNQHLLIGNKAVKITAVATPPNHQATATVLETLANTNQTTDWQEPAFSSLRGWPGVVTFHQDRMVLAASRDLPNRLWMSKAADIFNFDLGDGDDDDGIAFQVLSDQVDAIRSIISGREHMHVFTSSAEYALFGRPMTPANVELRRQTRIGSPLGRRVSPRIVDDSTVFAPRHGVGVYEFNFRDLENDYRATDLALLADHMAVGAVDLDYDRTQRWLHVVTESGGLSVLTIYRAEKVTAWSADVTDGYFRAVCVAGDTYVVTERAGAFAIERFDDAVKTDACLTGTDSPATTTWSGLDHLAGRTVRCVADGADAGPAVVSATGVVELPVAALAAEIGLPYRHEIALLPPGYMQIPPAMVAARMRLVRALMRVYGSRSMSVDIGRGTAEIPLRSMNAALLDQPLPAFDGVVQVHGIGWFPADGRSLLKVTDDTPMPFTLLSVDAMTAVGG
jgi:hypothetical protein